MVIKFISHDKKHVFHHKEGIFQVICGSSFKKPQVLFLTMKRKELGMLIRNYCHRFGKPVPAAKPELIQLLEQAIDSAKTLLASSFEAPYNFKTPLNIENLKPDVARYYTTLYLEQYFNKPSALDVRDVEEYENQDRKIFLTKLVRLARKGEVHALKGQIFNALEILRMACVEDLIEEFDEKLESSKRNPKELAVSKAVPAYLSSPLPEVQAYVFRRLSKAAS